MGTYKKKSKYPYIIHTLEPNLLNKKLKFAQVIGIEQKYCNTENKIVRKKPQEQRMYTKEIQTTVDTRQRTKTNKNKTQHRKLNK